MTTDSREDSGGRHGQGMTGIVHSSDVQAPDLQAREEGRRRPRPNRINFETEEGYAATIDIQDCHSVLNVLEAIKALYFPGVSILRLSLHLAPDSAFIPPRKSIHEIEFPPDQWVYLKIKVRAFNAH